MRTVATEAAECRERLNAIARGRRGLRTWASEGNFVFWQVDGDADCFARTFAEHGIGVRAFKSLPGVGDALRIGMAPWPQLERLVPIIEELWP